MDAQGGNPQLNTDLRPVAVQRAEQLAQASAAPAAWANQIAARRQSVGVAGIGLPLFRRVDLAARPGMATQFADRFAQRAGSFGTGRLPLLRRITPQPFADDPPDWSPSAPQSPARQTARARSDQVGTPATPISPEHLPPPTHIQPRRNLEQPSRPSTALPRMATPGLEPDVQGQEPSQYAPGAAYQPAEARVFSPPLGGGPGGSPLVRRLVEQRAFPSLGGAPGGSPLVRRLVEQRAFPPHIPVGTGAASPLVDRVATRNAFLPLAARAATPNAPAEPLTGRETPALPIVAALAPESAELSNQPTLPATNASRSEQVASSIPPSRSQNREPVSELALLRATVIRRASLSPSEEAPAQAQRSSVIQSAWSGASGAAPASGRVGAGGSHLLQTSATRPMTRTHAGALTGRAGAAAAEAAQRASSDLPDDMSHPTTPTLTPTLAPAIRPIITPMFVPTITRLPLAAASSGAPAAADEHATATRQPGDAPAIQEQRATSAPAIAAETNAPPAAASSRPDAGILPPLAANVLRRQALPAASQRPETLSLLRTRAPYTPSASVMPETPAADTAALPRTGDQANREIGALENFDLKPTPIAAAYPGAATVMRSVIIPPFPLPDRAPSGQSAIGGDQWTSAAPPIGARPLTTRADPVGSRFVTLQREAAAPDHFAQGLGSVPASADFAQGLGGVPAFAGAGGYPRSDGQPGVSEGNQAGGRPTYVRRSIDQTNTPFALPSQAFSTRSADDARASVARSVDMELIQPMRSVARQAEETGQHTYSAAIQMLPDESGTAEAAAPGQSAAAAPAEPDVAALAKKVYDHLRRQLLIDQERRGR